MFEAESFVEQNYAPTEIPLCYFMMLVINNEADIKLGENEKKLMANYFAQIFIARLMTGLKSEKSLKDSTIIFSQIFGAPELRLEYIYEDIEIINTVRITEKQEQLFKKEDLFREISIILNKQPRKFKNIGLIWD